MNHKYPLLHRMACKGGYFLSNHNDTCSYKEGPLPSCAPLAVAMVPKQQSSKPAYEAAEALAKGTLFPGLDLPFMDYVATGAMDNTPMAELMAIDFVLQELSLYLDTHQDDKEAFETWKAFQKLAAEGRKRYIEMCGPILRKDTALFSSWIWPDDPWPWDTSSGKAGRN